MNLLSKSKFILMGTLAFLYSCSENKQVGYPNSIKFNEGTISIGQLVDGVKLELNPIINIRAFEIIDTFIVCLGKSTANDFLMHIYSLTSSKLIKSFSSIGRGPNELIQLTHFHLFHERREIIVPDNGSQKVFVYSLDSLLNNDKSDPVKVIIPPRPPEEIGFDFRGLNVKIIDGPFRSQYMVNDTFFLQVVSHPVVPLIFVKTNLETMEISGMIGYPELSGLDTIINVAHFVNIFSPRYSYNSYAKKLVVAYNKTDLLEIYDTDLKMIVRLHGPDQFMPKFGFESFSSLGSPLSEPLKSSATSERDLVRDIPGLAKRAYSTPVATKYGFFVRYSGHVLPAKKDDPAPEFKSIYHFNYDGKILKKYIIDIKTALITVDSDERCLLAKDTLGDYYLYQLK